MIIYPAIDLHGGKVVRLKEGKTENETVFSDDPLHTAQLWIDQGATWLHMVNLDGAFSKANDNLNILSQVSKLNIPIQFGGGLRSLENIEYALHLGAARVVLGTIAVEQPEIVFEALARFGADKICVALDARNGKVTTHGWTAESEVTPQELGQAMAKKGVVHALYTDVQRDGSLAGVNIHNTVQLAQETGLQVIASGGVSRTDEIQQLAQSQVVAGAIIGMALYTKQITLTDALLAARSRPC